MAVGLVGAVLAGCTSFTPLYGGSASAGTASARFNFAAPETRLEQVILNRLKLAFPGPATPADPVLDVTAHASEPQSPLSNAVAAGRPVNVRVEATVTIARDGETLFEAARFSDTSYQGDKLAPTNRASVTTAQETAAGGVAEALRAAILAGYRF